jgi:hypothetical protein
MLYNIPPHDEHQHLQIRVTDKIRQLAQRDTPPEVRHFTITRAGADMRAACWCGKAKIFRFQQVNVFLRSLDAWLYSHEDCEPMEAGR